MTELILGTTGFILYVIYDINSVRWHSRILQKCFAAGSVLVAGSTAVYVGKAIAKNTPRFTPLIVFGVGAVLFFVLLLYTLFFALPFDETYVKDSEIRLAYTEGVYALCRHPGVLWFAGLYLCLWGIDGTLSHGAFYGMMILWNVLYVVLQDLWSFPKTFINYTEYQKNTPFLIPDRRSMAKCLKRWTAK